MATAAENVAGRFSERGHGSDIGGSDTHFPWVCGTLLTLVLVLIGVTLRPPEDDPSSAKIAVGTYYVFFEHVSIMIFVGFGFLMTFLKRYGYSAVGYNFMLSCFVMLWNLWCAAWWENVHAGTPTSAFTITMPLMIEGLFGCGAVMISFGAVLGKTTPSQLMVIGFCEIILYSLNFFIGALNLSASDAGGSMFIHTFGAYFGLGLATVLSPPNAGKDDHPYNGSSYSSDMTAMIGTIFLWIFWPSFNGAVAGDGHQLRAIVNTVLSLAGSCLATFIASYVLVHSRVTWASQRKFDMVHIQNATLAGGVAMGASANMRLNPAASIGIGIAAGFLSTWGYHSVTDTLRSKFNIDDTCGVHNLHGMPGVFAAIVSAVVLAVANKDAYGATWTDIVSDGRSGGDQAGIQLLALLITLGIAFVGGFLTGWIAKLLPSPKYPYEVFSDHTQWEVPDDYVSAGQAAKGERGVTPMQAAVAHVAHLDRSRLGSFRATAAANREAKETFGDAAQTVELTAAQGSTAAHAADQAV